MSTDPAIHKKDIPFGELVPLNERNINLKSSRGYHRLLATINAVGLIEPLAVYPENGHYVILNGYLRYKACEELKVATLPCIIYQDKEAYTFNRMVNNLSGFQERRMLHKSLEKIDEKTVAKAFGMTTIRHRLAPNLLKDVHTQIAKAFEQDVISRTCVMEIAAVKPQRQLEILKEMKAKRNFGPTFLRALVLGTPESKRNPDRPLRKPWVKDPAKRKALVTRLDEASKQHDFYSALYRRYSADLLKMCFHVRQLITNASLSAYLEEKHPEILGNLKQIIAETPA
jgi:ParB family transcriptional regulator, chromosome partitioning protein